MDTKKNHLKKMNLKPVRANSTENLDILSMATKKMKQIDKLKEDEQMKDLHNDRVKSVMKGVDRMSYNFAHVSDEIMKIVTIFQEDVKEYEQVVNKPTIKAYKKKIEGSPVIMIRCDAECENITPWECFQMIYNFEIRKKWDKALPNLDVIEKIDSYNDYIYSMYKVSAFSFNKK